MSQPRKAKSLRPKREGKPEDFVSVARELECDEDKERFEQQLAKIAKAKVYRVDKGQSGAINN
jgi:hypothetical protein